MKQNNKRTSTTSVLTLLRTKVLMFIQSSGLFSQASKVFWNLFGTEILVVKQG